MSDSGNTVEQQAPLRNEGKTSPRIRRNKYIIKKLKSYINVGLIFSIIFHLAMIIIASINFKKCPIEPNIPLFLLIEGVTGIASKIVELLRNYIRKWIKVSRISSILSTADFILFILGSYFVFKVYKPDYDPSSGDENYCNKTVYIFALIYISITYAILILILVIIVCCFIGFIGFCACVTLSGDEDTENPPIENQ